METFFERSLTVLRGVVTLRGISYEFRQWTGEKLSSKLVAIDTETAEIETPTIPALAVTCVFDGQTAFLIHPDDLHRFIQLHSRINFVAHNASFDYHVIRQHLLRNKKRKTAKLWLRIADEGRLVCTMLLNQLVRNSYGSFPNPRDLSVLAKHYCEIEDLDKDDPWRRRFGETIGMNWREVEREAWDYAVRDPIATRLVFLELRNRARRRCDRFDVPDEVRRRYGLLNLKVQTRAAIALDDIHHRGIYLDVERRDEMEKSLRSEMQRLVGILNESVADIFKRHKKSGELQFTPTGKPRMNNGKLREYLAKIADEHELAVPVTKKTKEMSLARSFWQQFRELGPLIDIWVSLDETAKLVQFFGKLQDERVHPRYQTMVRTLRTSCGSPNIQQIPTRSGFRELFIPSPGHVFLIIDYAALELRTLVAVCEQQFGGSHLADVIRAGTDPHAYTAAMLLGLSLDELMQLDELERKKRRQQAKAINFGVPGGLGAKSLAAYAKTSFGVDMSVEEAEGFRERLLYEVYPEIGEYMEPDLADVLAENLKTNATRVRQYFPNSGLLSGAKAVVQGRKTKRDGKPYKQDFVESVWESLQLLNKNEDHDELIDNRESGDKLERRLFFGAAVLPHVGLVRGNCTFTARHNTPFQGLAAIGAKIALWELYEGGYHVVAFVHDEFVIQIPEQDDYNSAAEDVNRICCDSMESVCPNIPIQCEYAVSRCWSKDAQEVRDDKGRLLLWEPVHKETSTPRRTRTATRISTRRGTSATPSRDGKQRKPAARGLPRPSRQGTV